MNSNPHDLDGIDLWFFGGTPGPDDLDDACTLNRRNTPSIDEDDAKIPAFAHRCHCGNHRPASACSAQIGREIPRSDRVLLMSLQD